MKDHSSKEDQARMIDVGDKSPTLRTAAAEALVLLPDSVRQHVSNGDIHTPKGAVFPTAVVAGIMAAKKCPELLPLCHPIGLEHCNIDITENEGTVRIVCRTRAHHKTGVEMEALTGASVAALTVYDLCKGVSQGIRITGIRLLEKKGGKSDYRA